MLSAGIFAAESFFNTPKTQADHRRFTVIINRSCFSLLPGKKTLLINYAFGVIIKQEPVGVRKYFDNSRVLCYNYKQRR